MTTRKPLARLAVAAASVGAVFCIAGCATPGPLHVYALADAHASAVNDRSENAPAEVRSFLAPDEQLTGFAYDPFTDHFFLRLAPGNRVRVVDRPARAIKREFVIASAPSSGGGDLAVKPRTGHLFLLHPSQPAVVEATRLGEAVRTFALEGLAAPAIGIAYDAAQDRLFVASREGAAGAKITAHDLAGRQLAALTLDRDIAGSLAFDAERREFYAPLADRSGVGVFDERGKLVRTLPLAAGFVDVGPRSFVRVF